MPTCSGHCTKLYVASRLNSLIGSKHGLPLVHTIGGLHSMYAEDGAQHPPANAKRPSKKLREDDAPSDSAVQPNGFPPPLEGSRHKHAWDELVSTLALSML